MEGGGVIPAPAPRTGALVYPARTGRRRYPTEQAASGDRGAGGLVGASNHPKQALSQRSQGEESKEESMVAYYENEAALDAALRKAKTPQEAQKIAQDLEQRMAPSHWIQKALQALYDMI